MLDGIVSIHNPLGVRMPSIGKGSRGGEVLRTFLQNVWNSQGIEFKVDVDRRFLPEQFTRESAWTHALLIRCVSSKPVARLKTDASTQRVRYRLHQVDRSGPWTPSGSKVLLVLHWPLGTVNDLLQRGTPILHRHHCHHRKISQNGLLTRSISTILELVSRAALAGLHLRGLR